MTALVLLLATATQGLTQTQFELDKNATDELATEHLGTLKSKVNAGTGVTSLTVCERQFDDDGDNATPPLVVTIPTPDFTVLIDGEIMLVTALGAPSTQTGGCGFSDPADSAFQVRVWTVTRAQSGGTGALAHAGGSDVTWLNAETTADDDDDWDNVYASVLADEAETPPITENHECDDLGAVACSWEHDGFAVSVFTTGGSKDDLNINPIAALGEAGTGWKWTDSSVPDADEILDAFAIKYTNGNQLLFFGADRYATNGAKDFGFWFFRDEVSLNPDGTFTGNHTRPGPGPDEVPGNDDDTRGDLLALGTFTQGGAVTTLRLFEWVGAGGNTNGTLQSLTSLGDCSAGGGSAEGCTTVNNTTVPSPWDYAGKGGAAPDVIYSGGLIEGGLDLTALGMEGCFATFMAETRSAPEPGAQLKDFVLGSFESCEADITTTPSDGSGTALTTDSDLDGLNEIQIGTGSAGVDVTDTAEVDVQGLPEWSGTVDFYICGPIATGECTEDGVFASTESVDQDTTVVTSDSVNLTSVGRYCWRGEFTPSAASALAGLEGDTDASTGECFEVMPVTPVLTTTAVEPSVGLSPTIQTITVGEDEENLADLNGDGNVDGSDDANAFYGDTSIIDGALDCDAWSTENDGTAGSGVIDTDDDCTLIGYDGTSDGVEITVIDGEFAEADGSPIADGTALPTVFNAGAPNNSDVGDSDFAWSTNFGRVDSNGDEAIDGEDCHFGIIGDADILGSDPLCGFAVTPPAMFDGYIDLNGDGTITAAADTCANGCFFGRDVYNGLVKAGDVDFGLPVYDVATLTGTANQPGTNGPDTTYPSINDTTTDPANGILTFTLVGPDDCSTEAGGTPATSNPEEVTVSGDDTYITTGFTPDTPGDYHWKVAYSGDPPPPDDPLNTLGTEHNDACDKPGEDVTVRQIPTEVKTKQSWYPNDTATITSSVVGDFLGADGTVDFYLFNNGTCTPGTDNVNIKYAEQLTLTGGQHSEEVGTSNYPGSTAVAPPGFTWSAFAITTLYTDAASSSTGTYSWKVVYTPDDLDSAHTGIQSACTEVFSTTYTNDPGPGTDLD